MIRPLPNVLSAIRFPLGGIFAFMLVIRFTGKTISPWSFFVCFIAIALSDLTDGWVARKFDCQSDVGAVLDVSADSFYLLLSLGVLNAYHILPIWFTTIVVLKLVDFILSSRIFSTGKKTHFVFDSLGRATVVGFYHLPILMGIFPNVGIFKIAIPVLAFSAVCSSTLRWLSFGRQRLKKSPDDIILKNTEED